MRQAGETGQALAEAKSEETSPETNDDKVNLQSKDSTVEGGRQDSPKEREGKGLKLGKGKGKKPAWALAEESKEVKSHENEEHDADDLLAFVNGLVETINQSIKNYSFTMIGL